jgi:hypothetical protein
MTAEETNPADDFVSALDEELERGTLLNYVHDGRSKYRRFHWRRRKIMVDL